MIPRLQNDIPLSQSVKFMQKYSGKDYCLKINRSKLEDQGEYVVRAENSFGKKEHTALLKVESLVTNTSCKTFVLNAHYFDNAVFSVNPRESTPMRNKREQAEIEMFKEAEKKPRFAFPLRNRFIQSGNSVKIMCTADGFPTPEIKW